MAADEIVKGRTPKKRPELDSWTVLAIANSTENALRMVNDEMKQIRDAVIQNRLVLDTLMSERGGLCKMLGTLCCFHIPDYSENVTNIITHMRMWKL
uniref:Uncharacterized protein n=1 Tax=Sinocyclocheilus rhinocerous TaxID=307959 RepID=A0A673NGR9_9TELE